MNEFLKNSDNFNILKFLKQKIIILLENLIFLKNLLLNLYLLYHILKK